MTELYNQMISRQKEVFTESQQEKIRNTPVLVIGCGGLGGTVIEQLVRAGFEKVIFIIKKENEAFLCMTDEECRLMLELYEKYNNALKNKFKEL